jgi:hypothetical protein
MVLLRKSVPQNYNLKTAAELGVMSFLVFSSVCAEKFLKAKEKATLL